MIETLHMTMEVLADAKVEIFVFILAACVHFLLFSNRLPVKDLKAKPEEPTVREQKGRPAAAAEAEPQNVKPLPGPASCICYGMKELLRSDEVTQQLIETELRRLLASFEVPEDGTQAVLASACEGLGRLIAHPELLASIRAIVGEVTNPYLAENLLRGYWSGKAYSNFDSFLFTFGNFCKTNGIQIPRQAIILAIQYVVAADQIEAEAAQKQKARLALVGRGDVPVATPKVMTWEKLETIMKDLLPMLEDDSSRYVSFHRILDVVVKRDAEKCWDVVKNMQQQGLPPNNVTCSILLKGVRKQNQDKFLIDVMKVIDTREDKEIDEVLLGSLYEACIRCGQMKHLLEYVQKLRQKGGLIEIRSPHTGGSIIRAYGATGDMNGVWDTWNDLKRRGVEPTRITLGCMVEALAANDDPEGAYEVIQGALEDPNTRGLVTAVTYSSVLKSLNHKKCYHRVWEIYEEMIRQEVEFTTTTYNALLDVCARSGEISRAEPLLKQMVEQGLAPSVITYSTVIKAYCGANMLEQAFKLFEEMKSHTNLDPDEVTFNTLMDGCARYGLFDRGCEVLQEMRRTGIPPSNYTLSVVAKLANRSKKPKMAFKIVEALRVEYGLKLNMHVYNNLIHAAILDNDLMKAQELFATMLENKIQPDGRTYAMMLRATVTHKLDVLANVMLHIAFGMKVQDPRIVSHAHAKLHKSLLEQLLRPVQWAKAPLRSGNHLQEDVVTDVVEFLSSVEAVGLPKLLAEISKTMPSAAAMARP